MSGEKNLAEAQADFDALVARVTALEALPQAKVMPDDVKAAFKKVLEWMDANV
jgi:hypothetical protein